MNEKISVSQRNRRRMTGRGIAYSNIARSTIDFKDTVKSLKDLYLNQIEEIKLKNQKPRFYSLLYVVGIVLSLVMNYLKKENILELET
jgi:hypothetical protein